MPQLLGSARAATAAFVLVALLFAWAIPCHAQNAAAEKRFSFELSGSRLVAGEKTVKVLKGDRVELAWTTDRAADLHLHGYDLHLRARPEAPGALRFHATIAGRFPLELHDSSGRHRTLIYVEVHPR
jgi:hypothetical protein